MIKRFIKSLRESDAVIRQIYTQGGCYQFFLVLSSIDNNAECYINTDKNHIVTRIGGSFYDIDGVADSTENYQKASINDIRIAKNWGFSKKMLAATKQCVHCLEMT